uniref:Uncharacterized protein n=1 Tax=Caenorhabditis tropicalis TaxID=1561998 RepID=A0A1I7UIV9_9PELO
MTVKFKTLLALFFLFVAINSVNGLNVSQSTQNPVARTTTDDPIPINPYNTGLPWRRTSFTCENLPDEYIDCIDMCKELRPDEGGDNTVVAWILLNVGIIGIAVNMVVLYFRCRKRRKSMETVVSSSKENSKAGNSAAMKTKTTEQNGGEKKKSATKSDDTKTDAAEGKDGKEKKTENT